MLIVCGPTCAGKSTFASVALTLGVQAHDGSSRVKELFVSHHHENEDVIGFCRRWYREFGPEVFARENALILQAQGFDLSRTLFVGCRAEGEVKYLRSLSSNSKVIGIFADTSTRFERGLNRDRVDQPKTLPDFIARDMREYDLGLAGILAYSVDQLIMNEGISLAEFTELARHEINTFITHS